MADEPKTPEKVEIEKQRSIKAAHTGGSTHTDVETAAKVAEKKPAG